MNGLKHVAAICLTLAAGPSFGEAALKALEDRADLFGWEAVGRLDLGTQGFCSAVLVAPNLVLTAAHCLLDDKTGDRRSVDKVTFHAGLRDGASIADRPARRAVAHPNYDPRDEDPYNQLRHDVALVELETPIPAHEASPFGVAGFPDPGIPLAVVSYGRGRSNAASLERGCSVLAEGQDLAAFDCYGNPGTSGAPVFDVSGSRPTIVSIVSASSHYKNKPATLGMSLVGPIRDLKEALRTGAGVWPEPEPPTARHIAGGSTRNVGGARFLRP